MLKKLHCAMLTKSTLLLIKPSNLHAANIHEYPLVNANKRIMFVGH